MVILCPACSTSFNLPGEHITAKGSKLRCSKCGHIFRVRRAADGIDSEIFYKEIDRRKNREAGTEKVIAEVPKLSNSFDDLFADPPSSDEAQSGSTQFGFASFMDSEGSVATEDLDADNDPSLALDLSGFDMSTSTVDVPAKPDTTALGMAKNLPPLKKPQLPALGKAPIQEPPMSGGQTSALLPHANLSQETETKNDDDLLVSPSTRGSLFSSSLFGDEASLEPAPRQGVSSQKPDPEDITFGEPSIKDGSPMLNLDPLEDSEPKIDLFSSFMGASSGSSSEPDPFGDAFEDNSAGLDFESLATEAARIDAGFGSFHDKEDDPAPILTGGQPLKPEPAPLSSAPVAHAPAPEPKLRAAPLPDIAPKSEADTSQSFWAQDDTFGQTPANSIDPNFAPDGPSFDPETFTVNEPPAPAPAPPTNSRPGPPPPQIASQPAPPSQPSRAESPEPRKAVAPPPPKGNGLRKVVNFALIASLVTLGFLGLVATLNDGMLDFKQFGNMIEVAFGDGTYKPRPEWLSTTPGKDTGTPAPSTKTDTSSAPTPASPATSLRVEGVFVEKVRLSRKATVYVVRGMIQNNSGETRKDVRVQAHILDEDGVSLTQKEANIGALLSTKQLKKAKTNARALALLPKTSKPLKSSASLPFTVIFDEIPAAVAQGAPMLVRVDLTKK